MSEEPKIRTGACSDVGRGRENQEDSWLIREPETGPALRKHGRLMIVADGIGGSSAGEVASRLGVETVGDLYFTLEGDPRRRLRTAIQAANVRLLEEGERPGQRGMGTTVTAAVIQGDRLVVSWLGDSRAYLLRDRHLTQVTRDHRAPSFGGASSGGITRWLGMGISVEPDIREIPLQPGDRVLLCSDGLHGEVRDEEIARALALPPDRAVRDLVDLVLKRGAPDNVTALCAQVDQLPFAPHRHPVLAPGLDLDGLRLLEPLGQDQQHLWYLASEDLEHGERRLLCLIPPELQDDPEAALEIEEEEEALSRCRGPAIARVERADREKSLAYVCLRLPWQDSSPAAAASPGAAQEASVQEAELHSLQDRVHSPVQESSGVDAVAVVQVVSQVAAALALVRDSEDPSGAPHASDFWGDGDRYALCRWPSRRRQYAARTGKGVQPNPLVQDYLPPDFRFGDIPGPASDACFLGWLLQRLLPGPDGIPLPVQNLITALRSETARLRPNPLRALQDCLTALNNLPSA